MDRKLEKCQVCKGDKLLGTDNEELRLQIKDSKLRIEDFWGEGDINDDIKINYCPICGRKLNESI
ncbi:hypothetical protein BG261_05475 [Floricoccus tropicus]|uniref:Uncharacterized protein n=1 Tax=Floricoccus tropicus TaxID=1859473 RepID=A0A1E8GKS1_9LACT|nr:hypothetical protein [Floricoccus tropicus]OFI48840.1 hypothetical protein BG261_05475 [Floricoccus tropicus]